MKNQRIEGIIRHILTFAAGLLVMAGILSDEEASQIQDVALQLLAAVLAAIALIRSWITKEEPPAQTGEA